MKVELLWNGKIQVFLKSTCPIRSPTSTNPAWSLGALDRDLGGFINIFLRQIQHFVQRPLIVLEVTATVGVEDSGVHHLSKSNALAFLHLFDTAHVPLLSWLFGDGPVILFGTSHAESGLQHVLLADGKGVDVHDLVLEVLKAGFFVRSFRLDGEAEKSSDSTTNLVGVSHCSEKEV
jgi:hypothetical protein